MKKHSHLLFLFKPLLFSSHFFLILQEQKRSIFSMLYNFSSDTSNILDSTSKVNIAATRKMATPQPVPEPQTLVTSKAAATSRATKDPPSVVSSSRYGFDAYVYDHKKTTVKTGTTATAAGYVPVNYGGGDGAAEEEETYFTPNELKMLLLNYENLSPEEQDNLTQYVQRHGKPAADAKDQDDLFSR